MYSYARVSNTLAACGPPDVYFWAFYPSIFFFSFIMWPSNQFYFKNLSIMFYFTWKHYNTRGLMWSWFNVLIWSTVLCFKVFIIMCNRLVLKTWCYLIEFCIKTKQNDDRRKGSTKRQKDHKQQQGPPIVLIFTFYFLIFNFKGFY